MSVYFCKKDFQIQVRERPRPCWKDCPKDFLFFERRSPKIQNQLFHSLLFIWQKVEIFIIFWVESNMNFVWNPNEINTSFLVLFSNILKTNLKSQYCQEQSP